VRRDNGYFVDLFVRVSNKVTNGCRSFSFDMVFFFFFLVRVQVAIDMYTKFGYVVYRRVLGYYSGEEDAFGNLVIVCLCFFEIARQDMRKALARDPQKKSMIPLKHPVKPSDVIYN